MKINNRVKFEKIPQEYVEEVRKEAKEEDFPNDMFIEGGLSYKEAMPQIRENWWENEELFFNGLKKFTGEEALKNWIVWLSPNIRGHYHPERKDVVIVTTYTKDVSKQIMEEIFHQHYWIIWGNRSEQPWRDEQKWKISETVVGWFFDDFEVRKECYPFVVDVREKIEPIYDKYDGDEFTDFLNEIKNKLKDGSLNI